MYKYTAGATDFIVMMETPHNPPVHSHVGFSVLLRERLYSNWCFCSNRGDVLWWTHLDWVWRVQVFPACLTTDGLLGAKTVCVTLVWKQYNAKCCLQVNVRHKYPTMHCSADDSVTDVGRQRPMQLWWNVNNASIRFQISSVLALVTTVTHLQPARGFWGSDVIHAGQNVWKLLRWCIQRTREQ